MFLQKVIGKYKQFHVGPFHNHAGVWNQIQTSISTTLLFTYESSQRHSIKPFT